jgi:putative ABC transport system permease protein
MRLDKLQALNGMKNKVSMVQVSVKTDQFSVEKLGKSMEKISGNIEAKPVSQIVSAENSIQRKIQLLLAIISAIVLFTASMAVISAQVGMIIERGSEIGLMKALGASDRDVNNLFLSEVFIMGFVSGVFGFFIGAIISVVLSAAVFKSLPDIKLVVLPAAVAASVLVSLIASTFALKKMTELNPVTILRGE